MSKMRALSTWINKRIKKLKSYKSTVLEDEINNGGKLRAYKEVKNKISSLENSK